MPSTLLTLRTAVTDGLGNTNTKAETWADRALNYAQLLAALYFDPPELRVSDTLTLATPWTSVSLSTLTRPRVLDTIYNTTSSRRMWPISLDRWDILKPGGSGSALYYCRVGSTLYVSPVPTTNNSLTCFYHKYPAQLTVNTDQLDFDHYDPFIVSTALKFAWAFQEEGESADVFAKIGESIGIPLAMGTALRKSLEEGLRGQYNVLGAKA